MTTTELELPFAPQELFGRQDRLREALGRARLSGGVYFAPEDIYYLTGYNTPGHYYGFQALVVPADGEPFFVCRQVEESNVLARSVVSRRWVFTDTDVPAQVLISALTADGMSDGRLEVDVDSVAIAPRQFSLLEAWAGGRIDSQARCLRTLRAVKSDAEVALLREAAAVMKAGIGAAIDAVAVGATELDVAAACYSALIRAGGEYPGMPPMVASGNRAGIAHATWEGRRTIEAGDTVLLEIPGCVKRYHACQARTVSVGPPSAENRRRMDAALRCREAALAKLRPGVTCGEVDAALRASLRETGFDKHHLHRAGYGLGIAYPPHWDEGGIVSLRAGDETVLQPNMVFHLVPSLIVPELNGHVGFSETVRVTEDGCEVLTDKLVPRELQILPSGAVA
jgi:Xaa-Pro dipeptidase